MVRKNAVGYSSTRKKAEEEENDSKNEQGGWARALEKYEGNNSGSSGSTGGWARALEKYEGNKRNTSSSTSRQSITTQNTTTPKRTEEEHKARDERLERNARYIEALNVKSDRDARDQLLTDYGKAVEDFQTMYDGYLSKKDTTASETELEALQKKGSEIERYNDIIGQSGGLDYLQKQQKKDAENDRAYNRQLRGINVEDMSTAQRLFDTAWSTLKGTEENWLGSQMAGIDALVTPPEAMTAKAQTEAFSPDREKVRDTAWDYVTALVGRRMGGVDETSDSEECFRYTCFF